jgi:hypothetical protein
MNTIQKVSTRAGDEGKFAVENQGPMFVKKIFCTRQSFSQNIKAWEGPIKSDLSVGVPPLTDW